MKTQQMTAAEAHLRQRYNIPSNYDLTFFNGDKIERLPINHQPVVWFEHMDSMITVYNNGDCLESSFDCFGNLHKCFGNLHKKIGHKNENTKTRSRNT